MMAKRSFLGRIGRLVTATVFGALLAPAAHSQFLCLGDCADSDGAEEPLPLAAGVVDPLHPLADTSSAQFLEAAARYLSARKLNEPVGSVPPDPLHPLAQVDSAEFKEAMEAYQRAVEAERAGAQSRAAEPIHPLADTESASFKAAVVSYVSEQARARAVAESSIPEIMRPPIDGPVNRNR